MNNIELKIGKPKKAKPLTPTFEVREGTLAICKMMTHGDVVAGQLFHALLELWVEKKSKIVRKRDGVTREWVFLSRSDLQTLSGLSERQISDNAIPKLKKCPFFIIKSGRLSPNHVKQYQIHFEHEAFWQEVAGILDPTKEIKTKEHGLEWVTKMVDRTKLPYLFKRLYDAVSGGE